MLQVDFIKDNFSKVIDSLKKRNKDYSSDLKKIIDFNESRKKQQIKLDTLLSEVNTLSKQIGELFKNGKVDEANELKKEVEKIKLDLNKKDQDKKKEAKLIHEKIKNKQYEIKKLSTENKELYGSVKPTEISKVLENIEKVKINPSLIQPSKEIKSLGNFDVLINLHSEVQTQIVIKTVPQEESQ